MNNRSRASLLVLGLALLCLAPQCSSKNKTEQQRQSDEAVKKAEREAREATEQAQRERVDRERAERERAEAVKEAANWKAYAVISLIVSLVVVVVWVYKSTPPESRQPRPLDPLPRRLSVALLTGGVSTIGGVVAGELYNAVGAVVVSLGSSVLLLAGSSRFSAPASE